MSNVQFYLFEIDKNKEEALRLAAESAKALERKELKLLDLIKSLDEYVNNFEDAALREKALGYLSDVLAALPPKSLTTQQRNLLLEFAMSQFSFGAEGRIQSAKTILTLEGLGKFSQEGAKDAMNMIVQDVRPIMQFESHSERFVVLLLIDRLMNKYRSAMHTLHHTDGNFLPRLIAYLDGEKNPRNLMVIFSLLQVPMVEWDISAHASEMFEAVFNYFPITFRPPPNDPYGVSAQQLKDRLKDCIAATGHFAPHSFPALLDKLDSSSTNTKRDTIEAIDACIRRYGAPTINLYSVTLWDALKFEILNAQEEELADLALEALSSISLTLSSGTEAQVRNYILPVVKECNRHLEDTPTKQSQASGRILYAVAKPSSTACAVILKATMPHILTLYQSADSLPRRRGLIEVMIQLAKATIQVFGEWRTLDAEKFLINGGGTMKEHLSDSTSLQQALILLSNGLSFTETSEISFRLTALDGLVQFVRVRQLMDDKQIIRVIKALTDIVIEEAPYGRDEVKEAAVDGLVEIAHQKPQLVIDQAFPAFVAELPDTDNGNSTRYMSVLEGFAKLGAESKVFPTVILRLKNRVNVAIQNRASPRYVSALLSAMLFAFNREAAGLEGSEDCQKYYVEVAYPFLSRAFSLVDRHDEVASDAGTVSSTETTMKSPNSMVSNAQQHSCSSEAHGEVIEDENVLEVLGRLCNVIIRLQNVQLQSHIATHFVYPPSFLESLLQPDVSEQRKRTMILRTHLLAALHREAGGTWTMIDAELDNRPASVRMLDQLARFTLREDISTVVRNGSLRQISLLVNKFVPPASSQPAMSKLMGFIDPRTLPESDHSERERKIRILFAVTKGLLLRTDPSINTLLPHLLDCLRITDLSRLVARGFSSLLMPDDLLTKQNHCTIFPLHKQRVFFIVIPTITACFNTASDYMKKHFLIAVSGIVYWLPFQIIETELKTLLPLLLQSLTAVGDEPAVKAATIETFQTILSERPKALEEHASSLIDRLLSCTVSTKKGGSSSNPWNVRKLALQCLGGFPGRLRAELLLPYRRLVVKGLTVPLDDAKRAVRAEAVRCRSAWMALDEVEAGDD